MITPSAIAQESDATCGISTVVTLVPLASRSVAVPPCADDGLAHAGAGSRRTLGVRWPQQELPRWRRVR